MKLTAYPLYTHAPMLQPAAPVANTSQAEESPQSVAADLDHTGIQCQGWQLLCPIAFRATWNGGSNPKDIIVEFDEEPTQGTVAEEHRKAGIFVQSQEGSGLLTFYPGYQFKATEGYQLWMRGPVNRPKDGIAALETLVDVSLIPSSATINWQFTRPNQTIHFEANEPFGQLMLQAQQTHENVIVEIAEFAEDADAFEQALQALAESNAAQQFFQRMQNGFSANGHVNGHKPLSETASRWARQLNAPPPVSCICPTYGRVELLEEAIESFLRQDYPGQKELIVLNDYAEQTLIFDHPEVRVINLPTRFQSVGEKYKAAAALASHDLIFVWHDDDIYLPHRLSYTVAQLTPETGFFKAEQGWLWNAGVLTPSTAQLLHGGSCWRRSLFNQVQGYPHIDQGYDRGFEALCRADAPAALTIAPIKPAEHYYIYRQAGTGSYHLRTQGKEAQSASRIVDYITRQAWHHVIPTGEIQLQPQWKHEYTALVKQQLTDQPTAAAAVAKDEVPFPPPYHVIAPPPPLPAEQVKLIFRGDYPRKISVILPATNESILLQRTVEQFAATLPDNSEIIVVDNGSTDGCADFLLDGGCPNIHLVRTSEKLGVAGARNRGLAEAQGEIVVFADAHIDLPERWWQPLVCTLNQPQVGIVGPGIGVMGSPEIPPGCGQRISEAQLPVKWMSKQGEEPYPVPSLGGGFMAMRHDTLKVAGAFDDGMPQWGSEDLEICLRYWLLGYEVWVAPAVTVLHYFRKVSPYRIERQSVAHNRLRVALLHLNGDRLRRVLAALKNYGKFEEALDDAVVSDVWEKRAEFSARRKRDADWFFAKFAESCPV